MWYIDLYFKFQVQRHLKDSINLLKCIIGIKIYRSKNNQN